MNHIAAPRLRAPALERPGLAHAFFTRAGGASQGIYATLNGGSGSRDAPEAVAENRARMAAALGVAADRLLVPYQVHSQDAVVVTQPWAERPRCDGIVTATPGLAIGVTGADCGMILFADAGARVIGAAHAGWKGALTGVLEATIAAMEGQGARRADMTAVLGPTIGPSSYEVGPEFFQRFVADAGDHAAFFAPSGKAGHFMFDLPAFIIARLKRAGLGLVENLALDTYADEARFFSYRRATHRAEADYGRLVSAIVLG